MTINEKLIEILNDLAEINNDRVTGYERAAEQSKNMDTDLQSIFNNMAKDGRKYTAELMGEINKSGGIPARGSTKGKIYRVWMDLKATFSGYDRQSILESCEFGEDAVQKAYNEALASDIEIDDRTRKIISNQKAYLKTAHKLVKNYRDARWKMMTRL